jgi:addiction module HigA family antidote
MKKHPEELSMTIGKYLTLGYLEPMGLSQNELARNIGVPSSRINSIIKGHTKITMDTDARLCKFFEKTDGFFLHIQEDMDRREFKKKNDKELEFIVPYTKRYA